MGVYIGAASANAIEIKECSIRAYRNGKSICSDFF